MRKVVGFGISLIVAMFMAMNAMANDMTVSGGYTSMTLGVQQFSSSYSGVGVKVGFPVTDDLTFNIIGERYDMSVTNISATGVLYGANIEAHAGFTNPDAGRAGQIERAFNQVAALYFNFGYSALVVSATMGGNTYNSSVGGFSYGVGLQSPATWAWYYEIGHQGAVFPNGLIMSGAVAEVGYRF